MLEDSLCPSFYVCNMHELKHFESSDGGQDTRMLPVHPHIEVFGFLSRLLSDGE